MKWIAPVLSAAILALGQTTPSRVETSDEAMARLKDVKPDPIADRAKRQALARQFLSETDKSKKMLLAIQLMLLGETSPAYFDFLEPIARLALENVGPEPYPTGIEWPSDKPPELRPADYAHWETRTAVVGQ